MADGDCLDCDDILESICGIDPGKTGGICFLDPDTGAVLRLLPMPDEPALADLLDGARPRLTVLEKAQTMPKQGIVSAFTYGDHFGAIRGMLVALGLRHVLVAPREWTKELHKGTTAETPKLRSLQAAQRWFPKTNLLATERSKKAHEGLVDALLIADYGRRYIERGESKRGA